MDEIKSLHKPQWNLVGVDWHMIVGNQSVAKIVPNFEPGSPQYKWVTIVDCNVFEDHGWHAVDYRDLDMAKFDLEQWWHFMCRGERYKPNLHSRRPE